MTEQQIIDLGFKKTAGVRMIIEIKLPFPGTRLIEAWCINSDWFAGYTVNGIHASDTMRTPEDVKALYFGIMKKALLQ